jgi:antitoxin (DNA-binding transcriptional repressor) of toxin-antitoxin stability system
MAVITVSVAKDQLSHLVNLVEAGEVIPLARNGKTVAAIVPLDVVSDERLAVAILKDAEAVPGSSDVRDRWREVITRLKARSFVVWANVRTNTKLVSVDGQRVTLGFSNAVMLSSFTDSGYPAVVAAAISDTLGGTWTVEGILSS